MAEINPGSVNTIRVNSVIDTHGNVEVFSAVLRAGARADVVVDNSHSGGIAYPIDIPTGIVYAVGLNFKNEKFVVHPSTGKIVLGFKVPLWNECLEMVRRAAKKFPQARFIGWDVAITEMRPVLIEANFGPGGDLYQRWDKGGAWNFLKSKR